LILKKVQKTIEKYSMLSKGDRVLIGVSGGPDSMALLHILNKLQKEYNLELFVAHLNHGLRGSESDRDEKFVKEACKKMGINFFSKKISPRDLHASGVSLEESARKVRYEYFEELAKKLNCNRIALGHTSDDQAETVLMRFIRGSGLKGLGGIPPTRKNGLIIRPLIETWRKEIEEFLSSEGIQFVVDSTNQSEDFLRNRYRHKLIPFIEKEFNPGIKKTLVRTGETLRKDEELLQELLRERNDYFKITGEGIVFNLNSLRLFSDARKLRIIRNAIEKFVGDLRGFSSVHFLDLLKIISSKKPNQQLCLPRGLIAIKGYDNLNILTNKNKKLKIKFKVKLNINGSTYIPELDLTINSRLIDRKNLKHLKMPDNIAILDYDLLKKPLFFRNYEAGDRFIPFGSPGTKKLKDFFIDLKVPLYERYRIPLLVSRDIIAWVAGYRIDDRFKITDKTKRVLELKLVFS